MAFLSSPIAQRPERLAYIQHVGGSNPSGTTHIARGDRYPEEPHKLFLTGSLPVLAKET